VIYTVFAGDTSPFTGMERERIGKWKIIKIMNKYSLRRLAKTIHWYMSSLSMPTVSTSSMPLNMRK